VTATEQLVAAVNSDDVAAASELLTDHPELRARLDEALPGLPFASTPLLAAVWRGSKPMVELLLAHGANINQRSHWWAGGFGVLDDPHGLGDYLIERGAQVDIHAASRLGQLDTIKTLLSKDPSLVHARGGDGQTPLHVAANVAVATVLVDAGADVDARDVDHESTPAQYAIRERQDVARYLVSRGCRTDLLMACALGDIDLVRRHLDADPLSIEMTVSAEDFPMANPHAGGTIYIWTLGGHKSPHAVAREFGHESVFRLLIGRSPDDLALAAACEVADESLVKTLLNGQSLGPPRLRERLHRRIVDAAERNAAPVVGLMLHAGWPSDARGKHGATALHFAAWHGNANLVREILAHHPALEERDRDFNMTPLGWACHGSSHSWNRETGDYGATVAALLAAGAMPPDGNPGGSTAVQETLRRFRKQDA
jgi:ankyrin repeat protein